MGNPGKARKAFSDKTNAREHDVIFFISFGETEDKQN